MSNVIYLILQRILAFWGGDRACQGLGKCTQLGRTEASPVLISVPAAVLRDHRDTTCPRPEGLIELVPMCQHFYKTPPSGYGGGHPGRLRGRETQEILVSNHTGGGQNQSQRCLLPLQSCGRSCSWGGSVLDLPGHVHQLGQMLAV